MSVHKKGLVQMMVERITSQQSPANPVGRPSQYNAKIFPRTWSLVPRNSSLVLHRNINFIPKKGGRTKN